MLKCCFIGGGLWFLLPVLITAQEDYTTDSEFFQAQLPIYQEWLERQNLASWFVFQEEPMQIKSNSLLLQLHFNVVGIDPSINAIKQLNNVYQKETGISLEEALFLKAVHLFEVPHEHLKIKVESLSNNEEALGVASILRYKQIYTDDTKVFTIAPFSFLRSEVKDSVIIHQFELPKNFLIPLQKEIGDKSYYQKLNALKIHIQEQVRAYFRAKNGELIFLKAIAKDGINFGIKNLKHEVIEPGILKNILGIDLLDPHEKLFFTIKLIPLEDQSLKIITTIDGKYGPGLYKPRSADYHEMDPDFQKDLEDYTKQFASHYIYNWILAKKN